MKRRKFVTTASAGTLAMALPVLPTFSSIVAENRFGVAEASYVMRRYRNMASEKYPPFVNALEMIEHCAALGFGGAQLGIRKWDADFCKKLRGRVADLNMFIEGQIRLPKTKDDLDRFNSDIKAAKEVGIDVIRTACLSGRRYENFDTMGDFLSFRSSSIQSLQWAEPILSKHRIKLAVENHKDWRVSEFLEILKILDSEWIGITLDTGNNISLLEDPMEVVESLAPYAFSVHLKDMGVAEYEDGFLMSEVNLGEGFLDIEGMIKKIKKHNPDIRFNLEMITRDPLKIPCLTERYWATFNQISAIDLAKYLHKIRNIKSTSALPIVSDKPSDEQLGLELENNRTSMLFAKKNLGFK
jgi:sugar phosphate isomerase/epimerase